MSRFPRYLLSGDVAERCCDSYRDAEHREMCGKGWFAVAEESSRSFMEESMDLEEPSGMPDIASLQIEDID